MIISQGGFTLYLKMVEKKEDEKIEFKIVKFAPTITPSSYSYFISLQEITIEGEVPRLNFVIKKQMVNVDGSPKGISKQIFMPLADTEKVLQHALEFMKDIKE
jgi:hypothetical protein